MKVLRMTGSAARAWRENVPHLVDSEGNVVLQISPSREKSISAVIREARKKRQTISMNVSTGVSGEAPIAVVVTVKKTGHGQDDITWMTTVDGLRYVSGRDIVAADLFEKHGEVQLRYPNGTIARVVRDPGKKRPKFEDSLKTSPKPEHCECRNWGNAHEGRHHATCRWNASAPPEEKAQLPPTEADLVGLPPPELPKNTSVVVSTPDSPVVPAPSIDPPETCRHDCLNWAVPGGRTISPGSHHPACPFVRSWEIQQSREKAFVLVDVSTGERLRRATEEEKGEAELAVKKTGASIIHIDERPYAVVAESELEKAP